MKSREKEDSRAAVSANGSARCPGELAFDVVRRRSRAINVCSETERARCCCVQIPENKTSGPAIFRPGPKFVCGPNEHEAKDAKLTGNWNRSEAAAAAAAAAA